MINLLTRREMIASAIALPLLRALPVAAQRHVLEGLASAPGRAVGMDGAQLSAVHLNRTWSGDTCRSKVINRGASALRVKEVVLFELSLDLPPSTPIYGESFQMLSQSGGTLGAPKDLGSYTDRKHYKIPMPDGVETYFGAMTLTGPDGSTHGLGFTSTHRFAGLFRLRPPGSLQIVVDTWDLETFTQTTGKSRDTVLSTIGDRLATTHPRLAFPAPPTGWCSWYCFGPRVTAQNIVDNLDVIAKQIPGLRYVQIDDGYQPAMGDWLETGAAFGGDVRKVLDAIKARGFEPAIWVAPFIAEESSVVFQRHKEWFVKGTDGAPLRSDTVTFGGWRRGPWYVLDGTNPGVQAHLEHVFKTMRYEWGVTYFKLDANFWGAIHGGRFQNPRATRIEAYRGGMRAIGRGAGDAFLLGCNHPIWPSAGLIHGSRSSNDIKRTWDRIKTTAQQNLLRNWQNGRLWWNDPDAICLAGELPEHEFLFHATAIYATGGMLLSGDDLSTIPPARMALLRKLLPPTGVPAVFDDERLRTGTITLKDRRMLCLFNWEDQPADITVRLARSATLSDFWTGESLGRRERDLTLTAMPAHSARLLECADA
jgi:alpha-galactosidase